MYQGLCLSVDFGHLAKAQLYSCMQGWMSHRVRLYFIKMYSICNGGIEVHVALAQGFICNSVKCPL